MLAAASLSSVALLPAPDAPVTKRIASDIVGFREAKPRTTVSCRSSRPSTPPLSTTRTTGRCARYEPAVVEAWPAGRTPRGYLG